MRRDELHQRRTTPLKYGNRPRQHSRTGLRRPASRYTTGSYRRAIHRACEQKEFRSGVQTEFVIRQPLRFGTSSDWKPLRQYWAMPVPRSRKSTQKAILLLQPASQENSAKPSLNLDPILIEDGLCFFLAISRDADFLVGGVEARSAVPQ